jgi:AbrB family looped-hinge helix DNA binding protein
MKVDDFMNKQVLTVSSKGQISLPVAVRKQMSIDTGDKLVMYTPGDMIMLKALKLPKADEFESLLE